MIYYIDEYYDDIEELVEKLMDYIPNPSFQQIADVFPEGITVTECKEVKLHQFDVNDIVEALYQRIPEDMWPEDSERMSEKVEEALKEFANSIEINKIEQLNAKIPTVWVPTAEKTLYTLKELEGML